MALLTIKSNFADANSVGKYDYYKDIEDRSEIEKLKDQSILESAARVGITGFNWYNSDSKFKGIKDDFSFSDSRVQEAMKDLNPMYYDKLYDTNNWLEFGEKLDRIQKMDMAQRNLHQNLGTAGTFAMVGAVSMLDPLTYVAGAGFYKLNKASKAFEAMSNFKKAATIGGQASVVEGMSTAEIEYHSTQDWEAIPISMAAAFVLAGGISHAAYALDKSANNLQMQKIDEYFGDDAIQTKSPEEIRSNVDEVLDIGSLTPVKNFATKVLDTVTFGNSKVLSSKMRTMSNRGGFAANEASKFDLSPFPLQDQFGNKLDTSKVNAMDIQYKNQERLFRTIAKERSLLKELNEYNIQNGIPPVNEKAFEKLIMDSYRKQGVEYRRAKADIRNLMEETKELDEIRAKVDEEIRAKIEEEGTADSLSKNEIDDMIAKESYLRVEEAVKARTKQEYPDLMKNTDNSAQGRAVEARLEYYNGMYDELMASNFESARAYDPTFYSHIDYNADLIEAMPKKAKKLFEQAIKQSPEYQAEINRLNNKLAKLKEEEKLTLSEEKKVAKINSNSDMIEKKIADLESRIDELTNFNTTKVYDDFFAGNTDAVITAHSRAMALSNLPESNFGKLFLNAIDENNKMPHAEKNNVIESMASVEGFTRKDVENINPALVQSIDELWIASGKPKIRFTNEKVEDEGGYYDPSAHEIVIVRQPNTSLHGRTIVHELMHAVTVHKYHMDDAFRADMDTFFNEFVTSTNHIFNNVKFRNENVEITKILEEKIGKHDRRYFGYNTLEFISEAFSDTQFARALNEIEWNGSVPQKQSSFLRRMVDTILSYLGGRLIKGNTLDAFYKNIGSHVDPSFKISRSKIREAYGDIGKRFSKSYNKHRSLFKKKFKLRTEGKDTRAVEKELAKLQRETEAIRKEYEEFLHSHLKSIASDQNLTRKLETNKRRLKRKTASLEKNLKDNNEKLKEVRQSIYETITEIRDLKNRPRKQASSTVDNIIGRKNTERSFTLNEWAGNALPGALKGRKLTLDETVLQNEGFIKTDPESTFKYNYMVGGKIATQSAVGYDKLEDYSAYLNTVRDLSTEDKKTLLELFEDVQGTSQLAENPKALDQIGTRMASHFNYVTMGGQFSMYGLSEIAVGIMRANLSYLSEIIPAMRTTKKMYTGEKLSEIEEANVFLSDAISIIENSGKSRYGDSFSPDDIFAKGDKTLADKTLDKMGRLSKQFFKWSGLEGITTISKVAIPKSLTTRIIKEYKKNPNVVAKDLERFGFSKEFLSDLMKQPMIVDKNGNLSDFNFKEWNQDVADQFNMLMKRAVRETIIHVDATRLPNWAVNANTHWVFRLARQFMAFSLVAHERLLLAGVNERASMAMIGAITSAGILGSLQLASEEAAVAMGTLKPEDRRFDLSTDKGIKNMTEYMITRNSFSGNVGQMYDLFTEITDPSKSYAASTKMFGGITAGRTIQAIRAVDDAINGEFGTRRQANIIKSLIPYNNLVGIDFFNKHIARELIDKEY